MDANQLNEMMQGIQAHFNYTDEQMQTVLSNPKYLAMFEKAPEAAVTEFAFTVEEAHGCIHQHTQGQVIRIGSDGSIKGDDNPKICIYLVQAIIPIVFAAQEFIYAGMDPNEMKFTKVGCFDNGVQCGGFGHVSVAFQSRRTA